MLSEGAGGWPALAGAGAGDTERVSEEIELLGGRTHVSKKRLLEASLALGRELGDTGKETYGGWTMREVLAV